MSVETPPVFVQAGGETADRARRALWMLFGGRGGIAASSDLAVTQNGTPNMSVLVAGGMVAVPGTQSSVQGLYVVENRGTLSVSVPAADPTNPRIDLVVACVRDAQYSGPDSDARIIVVSGTPAASPTEPAVPSNSWVLAKVTVSAGATSITNAAITDQRTQRSGQEGVAVPLNTPRGTLGYAQATTGQTGVTTETDLTGLSVTVTVAAGRRIRVGGYVLVGGNTLDGRAIVNIKESATQVTSDAITVRRTDGGTSGGASPSAILTPSAGSHTYKLTLTGSGATVQSNAAAAAPAYILVEDIGAA